MDFEKPLQINTNQEKLGFKIEKLNRSNIELEQEKVNLYLNFADGEKNEVVKKIVDDFLAQGHEIEGKQIDFPADKEEIENWIYEYPQYFITKRLAEVALENSEYAPKLTKELTDRKEYSQLEQILQQYKGRESMFENCVREIESSLKDDELRDNILMALSHAVAKTEKRQEPQRIVGHEVAMRAEKKTARSLDEYKKLLQISDEELNALQGKELLLVGGGLSPIKSELKKEGIECVITNIDPIAESDEQIADNIIKGDFFDTTLGESKYHEIFALHSLPTYAFTPEQAKDFYRRSILSLEQNGVLRVMPIDKFSDSFTPAMRLSRKPVNNASVEFVERFKKRQDLFLVTEFVIEYKGALGKKTKMPGAKIEVIGSKDKIKDFLELI